MSDTQQEIRTILATITGGSVLVPGSVVAEVVDFSNPRPMKNVPDWLLGELLWNDWSVPVMNFSGLAGMTEGGEAVTGNRVLVLKSLSDSAAAPYLGLLINGVPRMKKVAEGALTEPKRVKDHPAVFREVTLGEEQVMIPDLDQLNQLLEKALADQSD